MDAEAVDGRLKEAEAESKEKFTAVASLIGTQKIVFLSVGTWLRLLPVKRYRLFCLILYLFTGSQFFPYILYIFI